MEKEIKVGDLVEVELSKKIYNGILLESPEPKIILLKLESGYNIGINKEKVLKIKFLKRIKHEKKQVEIKEDRNKKNVALVLCGGTIASHLDPKTGGVEALSSPEELFSFYPSIFEKVNIKKIEVPFTKSSEDIDFRDWKQIAKSCEKFLNDPDIDGVIVTHGTDILHYTSAALSFFIKNLNKPLILTYSQRSIDRGSSDAELNLECSTILATSDIAEVMLVGHGSIEDTFCYALRGTKVRKLHSSRRDAFKSVNTRAIAKVQDGKIEYLSSFKRRQNKQKAKLDLSYSEKVALIKVYPGQSPDILDYYMKKEYKGIILEMFGLGQIPALNARKNWIPKIKELNKKGIVIFGTAQTIYGRLDPFVYSNGRALLKSGVIYLGDMLSETALIKLSWVLGHKDWSTSREKIKEKMLENISGELNNRLLKD